MSDQPQSPEPSQPPATPAPPSSAPPGSPDPTGQEEELWQDRMSFKYFAGSAILWLIATIVLIWLWWTYRNSFQTNTFGKVIAILIFGSGLVVMLRAAVKVYSFHYRLTTQRLFVERGLLSRTTDQVELIRVDDVRTHKSLINRLFGLGDVEVISTDASEPDLKVIGIEGPDAVAEYIRHHTRALRSKRSLFVEQI